MAALCCFRSLNGLRSASLERESSPRRFFCAGKVKVCLVRHARALISAIVSEESQIIEAVQLNTGHIQTPLLDALSTCARSDYANFHLPGHKKGAGASSKAAEVLGTHAFLSDLPELPELDNLFCPEGPILAAQEQAARVFGAEQTFFLVNGTTVGVQAAIMATCKEDDHLILPRNAHQCAISGMVLSGCCPEYLYPEVDSAWGIASPITPEEVENTILRLKSEGASIGAVLLVSPTYHGLCSDVKTIADICHKHDLPLIVDEAHGAHFMFLDTLPPSALHSGADIVVQSTHKVLSSLSQSAMLHLGVTKFVDRDRVKQILQMLQSSSPSYLLLSSLDATTAQVASSSWQKSLQRAVNLASEAKASLSMIDGISVFDGKSLGRSSNGREPKGWVHDPLRVTIGTADLGLTGYELDDILRLDYGVTAELPSLLSITFVLSAATLPHEVNRLVAAFRSISEQQKEAREMVQEPSTKDEEFVKLTRLAKEIGATPRNAARLTPRNAFLAKSARVPLEKSVGRICAELLCPYPPGIPAISPGEIITEDLILLLKLVASQGGYISGLADSSFQTVRVVDG